MRSSEGDYTNVNRSTHDSLVDWFEEKNERLMSIAPNYWDWKTDCVPAVEA